MKPVPFTAYLADSTTGSPTSSAVPSQTRGRERTTASSPSMASTSPHRIRHRSRTFSAVAWRRSSRSSPSHGIDFEDVETVVRDAAGQDAFHQVRELPPGACPEPVLHGIADAA